MEPETQLPPPLNFKLRASKSQFTASTLHNKLMYDKEVHGL